MNSLDALKKLNLLYLEDDIAVRDNLEKTLKKFFNTVYVCASISEAEKIFYEKKIDFMLLDIEVEDGNGLDFLKTIREKRCSIPVIVATSHSTREYLLKAIPLNLTEYLIKPIIFDKLVDLLMKFGKKIIEKQDIIVRFKNGVVYKFIEKRFENLQENIECTAQEFELLELLIRNDNKITTYEEIEEEIYHSKEINKATIRNQITKIRKIVGKENIHLLSGKGYRLEI